MKTTTFACTLVSFALASGAILGCDDKTPTVQPESTSGQPAPSAAPVSTTPSATASTGPAASAAEPVPSPSASSSAAVLASAAAPAGSAKVKEPAGSTTGAKLSLKPASAKVTGKNFSLDLASPGCKADAECAVTIRLLPTGEYHVNKEYPYKFVATPAGGITYLGKTDANTFARAAGDFKEEGEKAATMTVRFKAPSPGEAKVTGTYKMSVCSAENCQIEQQAIAFSVPVI